MTETRDSRRDNGVVGSTTLRDLKGVLGRWITPSLVVSTPQGSETRMWTGCKYR